jgi:hypothetical protein
MIFPIPCNIITLNRVLQLHFDMLQIALLQSSYSWTFHKYLPSSVKGAVFQV